MRTNFKLRRLPHAASLLRTVALAAVLLTAATSLAQQSDDIRINGGIVTANGGAAALPESTTKGDAIGGGTLKVFAPTYVTVKAGADASSVATYQHGGATTLTDWLKGNAYANAEINQYNVTARVHETNWGTVEINGVAVTSGTPNAYDYGTKLTLTATPTEQQYVFIGWFTDKADSTLITENATLSYTVATERDTTFLAVFANEVKINVVANPENGGSVTVTSDQELKPGEVYNPLHTIYGSHVTVTATATNDWAFKGWYENNVLVCGKTVYTFEATKDTNLEARFTNEVIWVRVKKGN